MVLLGVTAANDFSDLRYWTIPAVTPEWYPKWYPVDLGYHLVWDTASRSDRRGAPDAFWGTPLGPVARVGHGVLRGQSTGQVVLGDGNPTGLILSQASCSAASSWASRVQESLLSDAAPFRITM